VLEQASELWTDARELKEQAKAKGDVGLALKAIDRLTKLVELRGRATGELASKVDVRVDASEASEAESAEEVGHAFLELLQASADDLPLGLRRHLVSVLLSGMPLDTDGEEVCS